MTNWTIAPSWTCVSALYVPGFGGVYGSGVPGLIGRLGRQRLHERCRRGCHRVLDHPAVREGDLALLTGIQYRLWTCGMFHGTQVELKLSCLNM